MILAKVMTVCFSLKAKAAFLWFQIQKDIPLQTIASFENERCVKEVGDLSEKKVLLDGLYWEKIK